MDQTMYWLPCTSPYYVGIPNDKSGEILKTNNENLKSMAHAENPTILSYKSARPDCSVQQGQLVVDAHLEVQKTLHSLHLLFNLRAKCFKVLL
jgi:hypothetical protein